MINIKRKLLCSAWLFLIIAGASICGHFIARQVATPINSSHESKDEIQKLKIELALMKAKRVNEIIKVKEHKRKIKELEAEIARMKNSSYYPKEDMKIDFDQK